LDIASEAAAGVTQRVSRTVMTSAGVTLSIGMVVALAGITDSASAQVSSRFDRLAATEVVIEAEPVDQQVPTFPADASARLRELNGVTSAGVTWRVDPTGHQVTTSLRQDEQPLPISVTAMSSSAWPTVGVDLRAGRLFGSFDERRAERVAVIGRPLASQLHIHRLDQAPAIFVDGIGFTVVGVLERTARHPELQLSLIVPAATVISLWGEAADGPLTMWVATKPGAAQVVGSQAALALRPENPNTLRVLVPPDPRGLREGVKSDLAATALVVALLALVVGGLGIANVTMLSVVQRRQEIGIRRAAGASRRDVTMQFLVEAALIGGLGGVVGTSLGVTVVASVAGVRHWTAVMEPGVVAFAPFLGVLTGAISGLYPSLRAAQVQPIEALRQ
jgi:putative ABC transport system permease protein